MRLVFVIGCFSLLFGCSPNGGSALTDFVSVEDQTALVPAIRYNQTADFRATPPAPGSAPEIKMGKPAVFTLDNGLQVIVVENFKLPKITFRLFIDADPVLEKDAAGYKEVLGMLIQRGTKLRSKAQIDDEIDFLGSKLSSDINGLTGQCLVKHADRFLAVMSDIVLNPSFPPVEYEKAINQMENNLAQQVDDPNIIAEKVGAVLCFGLNHPYGEMATPATLDNVRLSHIQDYYHTYFKPSNAYLVISGYVSLAQAEQYAKKYFGKWAKSVVPTHIYDPVPTPKETTLNFVHKPGAVQSVVNITYPIQLPPTSQDVIPVRLTNAILGGYFNSRVNQVLRETKGWTFSAKSKISPDERSSYFSGTMAVRNTVTDSAIGGFLAEMNRLRTEVLTEKELTLVKNVVAGQFARSLEDPATMANYVLNTLRYNLPSDFYDNYVNALNRISAKTVQEMARQYILPDQAHILVVGNKDNVADQLDHYAKNGKVQYYDAFGNLLAANAIPLPQDLTAEKIIDDYINAIGGYPVIRNVRSYYSKTLMKTRGPEFELRTWQKEGQKIAIEMKLNDKIVSRQTYDGYSGKQYSGAYGTSNIEGEPLNDLKEQALFCKEAWYLQNGYNVALKGTEDIDGKNAFRIEVLRGDGKKTLEYYDMKTSLKLREVNISIGADEEPYIIVNDFEDYKMVDGILVPHLVTVSGVFPVPFQLILEEANTTSEIQENIFKQ